MKKPLTVAGTIVGLLMLVLGIAGLFVPALPAAPLLFVAVICIVHFCPPFVAWFMKKPITSSYFDDFIRERSMTRLNKIKVLALSTIIVIVFLFVLKSIWVRAIIVAALAVEYYYLIFCVWTNVENGHGMSKNDAPADKA